MTVEKTVVQKLVFLRDTLENYNNTHDDFFEHQCQYDGMQFTISAYDIVNWIDNIEGRGETPAQSTLILSNQLYAAFMQLQRRVKNG